MASKEVMNWADGAMFESKPHETWTPQGGVLPDVKLIWMTPDPLGAMAVMCEMYKGNVIKSLKDVTDEMRVQALADVQATHLKAPLEAIKVSFMIDGVDRGFTHQLVRQRTAVYAQESQRFAVIEDLPHHTTLPPSLIGTEPNDGDPLARQAQRWRNKWDEAMQFLSETYTYLVNDGMPQEDARGLLPHAVATRVNYITDLRNLSDHAGNRLCTQAQFHWRMVFGQIVKEIKNAMWVPDGPMANLDMRENRWQYEAIAESPLFRPVCYQLGRCPFKASFDRPCSIRDRVDQFEKAGIPSGVWDTGHTPLNVDEPTIHPIKTEEWFMNPGAARKRAS